MIVRFNFVAFIFALLVVGCAECEGIDHTNVQETNSAEEPVKELEEVIVEDPIEEPTVEPVAKPVEDPSDKPVVEPIEEPTVEPIEEPTVEPIEEPTADPVEEIETPIEAPVCDRVRPVPRDGYTIVFVPTIDKEYSPCSPDVWTTGEDDPLYCPTNHCTARTPASKAWFPADADMNAFQEQICELEKYNYNSQEVCKDFRRSTFTWGACVPTKIYGAHYKNPCHTDCDCKRQLVNTEHTSEYEEYFCHTDGVCYKGAFEEREIHNDVIELPSELPSQA